MKKRFILNIIFIALIIVILYFIFKYKDKSVNSETGVLLNTKNDIYNSENITSLNIINDISDIINVYNENIENNPSKDNYYDSNFNSIIENDLSSTKLTFCDIPLTYDKPLSSKYSVGFMLHYKIQQPLEVDQNEKNKIDKYINENKPNKNGLWLADSGLQGIETTMSSRDRIIMIFNELGINCKINNGFVEKFDSSLELCEYANKIISSNKLVMIAFSPYYYTYVTNTEDEFVKEGISNKIINSEIYGEAYIKFESFDNIYPYIIKEGCSSDELLEIFKNICYELNL